MLRFAQANESSGRKLPRIIKSDLPTRLLAGHWSVAYVILKPHVAVKTRPQIHLFDDAQKRCLWVSIFTSPILQSLYPQRLAFL